MDVSPGRGPTEARVLGWSAARPVVEDTPSSTTAAGVAEEAGAAVYPFRWRDETARASAGRRSAAPAADRSRASEDRVAVVRRRDSGRELYEYGYPQDVAVATEADTSHTVPVLTDGAFQEAAA